MKASWIFSFAIVAALSACSASTTRDDNSVGSGADGGTGTGTGGSGGIGVGGSSGVGGSIAVDDGGGDEPLDCGGETFPLVRKPAKILLVFDRSESMIEDPAPPPNSNWDIVHPAVKAVVAQTDAQIAWGLKTFPEGDDDLCMLSNTIDVPIQSNNAAAVVAAIDATTPLGDGTPTGDAINAAVTYLKTLDAAGDTDTKYILLATDGQPSCVGGSETSQNEARPYAVTAVEQAAAAGYHTFVVGVTTDSDNERQTLNDMAVKGLEPRPDPNPLATKFYLANTKDELVAALSVITGVVLDCRFELSQLPDDGEHVGVRIGGETVPPDAWKFIGTDKHTVEVTGEWCNKIKAGQADVVRIVFGCPTDPIF